MLSRNSRVGKRRRFLNVSTGKCIFIRIPDLRSYYFLEPTTEGLLVLCQKGTYVIQLLNPLTGQITNFPRGSMQLILALKNRRYGTTASLIADDSTVAFISSYCTLVVAKPGDEHWTKLHVDDCIMTAFSLGGRLYCATRKNILVVETAVSKQPQLLAVVGYELKASVYHGVFPVHDDDRGDLILVHWYQKGDIQWHKAYRVKLDTGNLVPISGLGGQTLFICSDCSQSVPAWVSSSINADTIYTCKNHYDKNRPEVVAFDFLGTRSELKFQKKDIARYLMSHVCSQTQEKLMIRSQYVTLFK
ncbi:unnamed protein product [Urochloa humidicola]